MTVEATKKPFSKSSTISCTGKLLLFSHHSQMPQQWLAASLIVSKKNVHVEPYADPHVVDPPSPPYSVYHHLGSRNHQDNQELPR